MLGATFWKSSFLSWGLGVDSMGVGGWWWSGAGLPDHIPREHDYLPSNAATLDGCQETDVKRMSLGAPQKKKEHVMAYSGCWVGNMKTRWAMCREKLVGQV